MCPQGETTMHRYSQRSPSMMGGVPVASLRGQSCDTRSRASQATESTSSDYPAQIEKSATSKVGPFQAYNSWYKAIAGTPRREASIDTSLRSRGREQLHRRHRNSNRTESLL